MIWLLLTFWEFLPIFSLFQMSMSMSNYARLFAEFMQKIKSSLRSYTADDTPKLLFDLNSLVAQVNFKSILHWWIRP